MKKSRAAAILLALALIPSAVCAVPVSAAEDVIYSENFDGKSTADIKYDLSYYHAIPESDGKQCLDYEVKDGVLHVFNKEENTQINFLPLVGSDLLAGRDGYVIELDMKPVKVDSASYGVGIALHPGFPAEGVEPNKDNMRSYDEYVFRDYNMDGVLSFGRYRRESGKAGGGSANRIIDDISSGFGEWYKIKLVVRGENVDVYFGDAEKPVMNVVNTYSDKGAICLVSVGSGEFYADNIKITAAEPMTTVPVTSEPVTTVPKETGPTVTTEPSGTGSDTLNSPGSSDTRMPDTSGTETGKNGGFPIVPVIAAGCAVIAAAVILPIVLKKKKTE